MASVEFTGPEGGTPAIELKKEKKDKFGFSGPIDVTETAAGPDIGQGNAAAIGLLTGATFGAGGLMGGAGLTEAGMAMPGADFEAMARAQQEARRVQAENLRRAQEQYPKTTAASEFAGGMLSPIPAPRGTGLLGRMAVGAGTGGVIGGVSSFGGEENPTPGQFALSTGVGAATGGVFPAVTSGLGALGRAGAERLGITRLPFLRNAEQEAATEVTRAVREAAVVEQEARRRALAEGYPYEPQTLTPAQLGPGRPGMAIDVAGVPGQELARSAANLSPVARATLEGPLYQRRATQLARAEVELTPTLNRPLAGQEREALARPSPQTNQAYRVAREIGDGRIELTPPLQQLAQTRVVQTAFRRIESDLADAHGIDSMQRQAQGLPPRNPPSLNDLAVWDLVKRRLDDMYKQAQRASNYTRANLISDATRMLRGALDTQVPEYAQARTMARAEILARDAFEEGRAFLTGGDLHETQQALAQLAQTSPQAIGAFQQGFTHAMLERMRKKATAGNLYAQVKETPDQTARMTIALGANRTAQQAEQRAQEEIMQRGLNAVVGNSTTARQLSRLQQAAGQGALAGGGLALGLTADELFGIGHRLHSAGLGVSLPFVIQTLTHRPGLNMDVQVANRIAQMLVSRDPQQLDRLSRLAQQSTPLRAALNSINNVLGEAPARGAAVTATQAVAP